MRKTYCFIKVSAVAIGLGLGIQAFAAGFQINELSPTIQATALATASGDISGMAYNPATLATIQGTDIYAAGSAIIPEVGYSNASSHLATDTIPPVTLSPGTVNSENDISPNVIVPAL